MTALDWPGMMRAGLGGLHLRPAEFWALTPLELMLMLGIDPSSAPMNRARLEDLARAFPDRAPLKEREDAADRGI